MEELTVLVTSAHTREAYNVIRCLKESNIRNMKIIGLGYSKYCGGLWLCDFSYFIKRYEYPRKFLAVVKKLIQKINNIKVIIPTREWEIISLSRINNIKNVQEEPVLIPSSDVKIIKRLRDKAKLTLYLKKINVCYPDTFLVNSVREATKIFEYPFVIKPRFGTDGKYVFIIKDQKHARRVETLFKKKSNSSRKNSLMDMKERRIHTPLKAGTLQE